MTISSEEIGANVRGEMARRQVRQQEVAARLGLTQPAVSARMAGRTPFRAGELAQLAELLGVPVARFYEPEGVAS